MLRLQTLELDSIEIDFGDVSSPPKPAEELWIKVVQRRTANWYPHHHACQGAEGSQNGMADALHRSSWVEMRGHIICDICLLYV